MPTDSGGVIRYDINDPADMAALIKSGLVWRGGPKTVGKAVRYLQQHPDEVNDLVPENVLAMLRPPAPKPDEAEPVEEPVEPVTEGEGPSAPTP